MGLLQLNAFIVLIAVLLHHANVAGLNPQVHWVLANYHKTGYDLCSYFGRDVFKNIPGCSRVTVKEHPLPNRIENMTQLPEIDVAIFRHGIQFEAFSVDSHYFRIVHFVREPFDMIVSGFLYHSQNPGSPSEGWMFRSDYDPCHLDMVNINATIPILKSFANGKMDIARMVNNVAELCVKLKSRYPAANYNQLLISTRKSGNDMDGILLEACRAILFERQGDILKMAHNMLEERQLRPSYGKVLRMYTSDFPVTDAAKFKESTEKLFDFLMPEVHDGASAGGKPFYSCSTKRETVDSALLAAYKNLPKEYAEKSRLFKEGQSVGIDKAKDKRQHITTDQMASKLRGDYIARLEKDPVVGPLLLLVEDLCTILTGPQRYGCCKTKSLKYLHNVMLENGKVILFEGAKFNRQASTELRAVRELPPVESVMKRKVHKLDWPVEYQKRDFNRTKCKQYINGTVHIFGRLTTNNLFHAINDNLLPLVSLAVLDSYLDPQYNSLVRAQLVNFQVDSEKESVRHMVLQRHLVPFTIDVSPYQSRGSAAGPPPRGSGLCVRRVVWGSGPKLMYHHLLRKLRRETVALARHSVRGIYNAPLPEAYLRYPAPPTDIVSGLLVAGAAVLGSSSSSVEANSTTAKPRPKYPPDTLVLDVSQNCRPLSQFTSRKTAEGLLIVPCADPALFRPMNIVLYTRGDSGNGRTLKGESLFIERFTQLKAFATLCCGFKRTPLEEQLSYALHADVIMGLHGAGLINALFAGGRSLPGSDPIVVELKSQYGERLDLFAVASDSLQAVHIQIDLASTHSNGAGGHKPVDAALVDRVTSSLLSAMRLQSEHLRAHLAAMAAANTTAIAVGDSPCGTVYCTGKMEVPERQYKKDIILFPPHDPVFPASQSGKPSRAAVKTGQHILGPPAAETASACRELTTFNHYWAQIGSDSRQYCTCASDANSL